MLSLFIAFHVVLMGCGESHVDPDPLVEEGEWLPGGDTTNTRMLGANAFLMPAQNLTIETELAFYSGNAFFNQGWVVSPASTDARDGLGPLFNARSCSACHFRDGKGEPPEDGDGPFVGLLLKLSVPGPDGPIPHPVYGDQLQDQASPEVPVEGIPHMEWIEHEGRYADGTPFTLVEPSITVEELAYGPLGDDIMMSARIAPHMIGLGLLEAIPVERLKQLESEGEGRIHWVDGIDTIMPGRFGWKANAPTVEIQSAAAFAGDMGLTSTIAPFDDCTDNQEDCLDAIDGGDPEVTDRIMDRVVTYSSTIAVPARRRVNDPTVLRGKKLFNDIGCASCHTPSHRTGASPIAEMSDQLIWPYTDLLLHDMGEGLSDNRPSGDAKPSEWKTPPLWGLGLMPKVSGHSRYLHDGRARSIEEAILWHGGEAQPTTDEFMALNRQQREAVIAFVEDL